MGCDREEETGEKLVAAMVVSNRAWRRREEGERESF